MKIYLTPVMELLTEKMEIGLLLAFNSFLLWIPRSELWCVTVLTNLLHPIGKPCNKASLSIRYWQLSIDNDWIINR